MLPKTARGSTLQSTNSVVKSFFQASGPGQTAALQAQKLEFPAFADISDDKLFYKGAFISGVWGS